MPADQGHIDDWLRVHRQLVDLEIAFGDVAMKAASGEITAQQLERERAHLIAMRALCTAAYAKAFPDAATQGNASGA